MKKKIQFNIGNKNNVLYDFSNSGCWKLNRETDFFKTYKKNPLQVQSIKNAAGKTNLRALAEIVQLCRNYGVELTVFTTPLYQDTQESIHVEDYLNFLRDMAFVTAYWDFSGYNSITTNTEFYFETSHYRPVVGNLIAGRIFNDSSVNIPNDFGIYVEPSAIEVFMKRKQNELNRFHNNDQ